MPRKAKAPAGAQQERRMPQKPAAPPDEAKTREPQPRAEEVRDSQESAPHAEEGVGNDPHPKVESTPVDEGEPWDAGVKRVDAARNAVFRPDPGISIEDPQYRKELRAWLDEWEEVGKQKPELLAGHDPDPPHPKATPGVRVVQPETMDQQTPQIPWIPNAPGNMGRVEVIATDPSHSQQMHPAGDMPVSNEDLGSILEQNPQLGELIQRYVDAALAADRMPKANTMREYLPHAPSAPTPQPNALGHYRNDAQPEIKIMRMTPPDDDAPDNSPMSYDHENRGQWIQFRKGHFIATEPWQKEQLDWMMKHPQNHPLRQTEVLGGDPHIYLHAEDAPVYWCPAPGCEFVTGSQRSLDAHRKATHGG